MRSGRNATSRTPVVGYLGWHGRGNLGDDAIYDAVRAQLPEAAFVDLPRFRHEVIRAAATGLNRRLRRGVQMVGGGTLVGTSYFRQLAQRGMTLTRAKGSFAIGVGVEDPDFIRRRYGSDGDELKRWAPILSDFHTVSVRGPRSAELLSEVGLSVEVSGDPALLLPVPDVVAEDGLIGLNLGFGDDDLWGQDPAMVAHEISLAVAQLSSRGHRFVGILMNRADERWTRLALNGIDAEVVMPADARAAAHELARCSVAIVSRLHAGILAAISATPVVALEYLPKCRDFARSIGNEQSLIRTDKLRAAVVVDHVGSALADSASIRANTQAQVAELRRRLDTEYTAVRHQLGATC
ncbi:polysaccharide pyruvyl transferase family protein [Mycobacterium sp. NPDC048908]|uniref:polysaccharide pyruvyl transferase family protein n=1 Tax=Mycobacterium sp. NPDC048908 TaxID=3364292 RepID=UPI003721CE22